VNLPADLLPDDAEVARVQYYRRLLKLFVTATKDLEGDDVTSVLVPKTMYGLWRDVTAAAHDRNTPLEVKQYALALASAIETRVGHDWKTCTVYTCAAMLDPNQPDSALTFLGDNVVKRSIDKLVDESFLLDPCVDSDDSDDDVATAARPLRCVLLAKVRATYGDRLSPVDVLAYWRSAARGASGADNHARRLVGCMPNTVKAFLAVPASSSASERLFSSAGVVAHGRMLGDERLENETLIRVWLKQRHQTKDEFVNLIKEVANKIVELS
jgi:hypothetical protein